MLPTPKRLLMKIKTIEEDRIKLKKFREFIETVVIAGVKKCVITHGSSQVQRRRECTRSRYVTATAYIQKANIHTLMRSGPSSKL